MKFIINIIKGMLIGVANIIPGVSGGTMAVITGAYDKIIFAINNITKEFKKSVLTLLPILIGAVGGIGVFSFILPHCLSHYSLQTSLCFIGLIVGGIPFIYTSTMNSLKKEQKKINPLHIIVFLLMVGVAVFMALANPDSTNADSLKANPQTMLIIFVLGAVCAAAMVIPGVSGSLLLMMFGYYSGIIGTISQFLTALKDLDGKGLLHCILILVPFAIGCILGIVLISKLLSFLYKRFESYTYFGIFGLVAASPFAILCKMENPVYKPTTIIVGVILFLVGALFTYFFEKFTSKADKDK